MTFRKLDAAALSAEVGEEFSASKTQAREGGLLSAHFRRSQYKGNI